MKAFVVPYAISENGSEADKKSSSRTQLQIDKAPRVLEFLRNSERP